MAAGGGRRRRRRGRSLAFSVAAVVVLNAAAFAAYLAGWWSPWGTGALVGVARESKEAVPAFASTSGARTSFGARTVGKGGLAGEGTSLNSPDPAVAGASSSGATAADLPAAASATEGVSGATNDLSSTNVTGGAAVSATNGETDGAAAVAGEERPGKSRALTELMVHTVLVRAFVREVGWPEGALGPDGGELWVGVPGDERVAREMAAVLAELGAGAEVLNRRLVLIASDDPDVLGRCPVLFFSRSEASVAAEWLEVLNRRGVLTVGDGPGFLEQGGMIQLVAKDGTVKYALNLRVAQANGFAISEKLASAALPGPAPGANPGP